MWEGPQITWSDRETQWHSALPTPKHVSAAVLDPSESPRYQLDTTLLPLLMCGAK